MTDRIRIKQYEQAADEKVSIGGIKWVRKWDVCIQCDSAEEAERVRARLAQPEHDTVTFGIDALPQGKPEPVAWLDSLDRAQPHAVTGFQYLSVSQIERGEQHKYIPVYAAPPQREWQGLTDEEREKATGWSVEHIESALKTKNA